MRCFEKYDYTTFNSFVESVYKDEPSYYTRLVEWMTGPANAGMVNLIGKQENLNRDLATVLKKVGLGHLENRALNMKKRNTSKSSFEIDPWIGQLIEDFETPMYRRFNYNKKYSE